MRFIQAAVLPPVLSLTCRILKNLRKNAGRINLSRWIITRMNWKGIAGIHEKAVKWEIRQIVGDNFPYNYDGDILHTVSHDGPDQFYIKDGVMYKGSQDKV